jgi:VanZ family protein
LRNKFNISVYIILSLAVILTVGFIFNNSIKSPEESSKQSQEVVETLRPIVDPSNKVSDKDLTHKVRKSAHFLEFALLGFELSLLTFFAKKGFSANVLVYSASSCLLVATLDEYIQSFTDRGSSVTDVIIDSCGSVTGIVLGLAIAFTVALTARIISKKRSSAAKI